MPAYSEVAIANMALGWLGANLITSLQDGSTEAKLMDANFFAIRDAVLEEVDWRFATARYSLVLSAEKPEFEYANKFLIKENVLKVITVNENKYDWQREGEYILSDEAVCNIRCIVRIVSPALFTPLFVQALAARLAADLAMPLTQNRTLQGDMYALYKVKLTEAKSSDGQQGKSRKLRMRKLLQARSTSGNFFGPTV